MLVLALVVGGVSWAVNTAFDGFGPAVQTNEPTAGGSEAPAEGGEGTGSGGEEAPATPEVRPMIASGTASTPRGRRRQQRRRAP